MSRLKRTIKAATLAAVVAGGLAVLCGCGGGGATFHATGNKTLGRELQDLQQSYDKGIISEKEYRDAKKRLIRKYTD